MEKMVNCIVCGGEYFLVVLNNRSSFESKVDLIVAGFVCSDCRPMSYFVTD